MHVTEQWLETFFDEVEPMEFYRGIFGSDLDKAEAFTKGKYTGIIVGVSMDQNEDGRVRRWTLTDDLAAIQTAADSGCFCLCSPISYIGKARTAENARMLYAFAVDVDKIKVRSDGVPVGIMSLWNAQIMNTERLPRPTYIVSSGTGIHLYYVLEQPIALYKNAVRELQIFKHELTRLIWNDAVCDIHNAKEIQYEGIYQGFRMVGTLTKIGGRARAFETGDKVSMEYLNGFVGEKYRVTSAACRQRGSVTLEEAKEKYPEWYQKRVVNKEPRGVWHVNRSLYEWWKKRIRDGAVVGHRYYCLMTLAVYAQKCSFYDAEKNPMPVTLEELTQDAFELMDVFEAMTEDDNNHFTRADVLNALEAFNERYISFSRATIEYKSGISIPATKRNRQKQADHLEEARAIRDIRMRRQGKNWRDGNGRPSKEMDVISWRKEHPDGSKADCIRALRLSKPTVYKYWDM